MCVCVCVCVCPISFHGVCVNGVLSLHYLQLKRVANQTKAGKKRTVSALVVVGNGRGAAGTSLFNL